MTKTEQPRAALATPAASPATEDLVSRAEVLRVIRSLGAQDADLAMYGAADNARAREYGEAAATRACCAIALMPPASPSPAPAAVEELVARLREAAKHSDPLWESSRDKLDLEAATALSTLAADKARIEAERDRFHAALTKIDAIRNSIIGFQNVGWSDHIYPLVAALNDAGFQGKSYKEASTEIRTMLAAERQAEAAEARASALEGEVERLRDAIGWALGEGDSDFGDHKPENAKPFWWRTELRARAAIRKETP